jgi:sugar phosphate isomerase/epimerase
MYVSLSAYGGTDLQTSLNALSEAGVRQVQLSVGVRPDDSNTRVLPQYGFEYMVHSNFPLSSQQYKYDLVSGSTFLDEFKRMFQFCQATGIKTYSFHTGQYASHKVNPKRAYGTFVENLAKVAETAEEHGIGIAVETMYPSASATRWVLDNEADIRSFLAEELPVGIVADCAHIKIGVTRGTMTPELFSDLLAHPSLAEIHISDNDGLKDIHQALSEDSLWFVEALLGRTNRVAPVVYEGRMNGWSSCEVREHLEQVKRWIDGRMVGTQAARNA